jgi:hypothetical protein
VTNGGTGTLSGLAIGQVTYGPEAANWLDLELSGTEAPATLRLGVTAASLLAGTYTATIPITSTLVGVSPQNINVTFLVTPTSTTGGIFAASFGGASDLYVVEPSPTGNDVELGPIATAAGARPDITDFALAPDGTLYGISFSTLYTIDKSNGAAVEVGDLGVSTANALAFASDGKLFGATNTGTFFQVNVTNGNATEIGSLGAGVVADGDIVFAPGSGILYGTVVQGGDVVLVTIDPATGQATRVSTSELGFTNVWGLAYFESKLYGLTAGPGAALGELVEINVTSGVATKVRNLSFDTGGAAAARP